MPLQTQLTRGRSTVARRGKRAGTDVRGVSGQTGGRVRVVSAEGGCGVLRFVLRRVAGGLYVEREEFPRRGTRTSISVEFADRQDFERWCNDDPSRFDNPLLHQRVRRDAEELWQFDS